MNQLSLTYRKEQISVSDKRHLKSEKFWIRILTWIFMIDIAIICALMFKLFYLDQSSTPLAFASTNRDVINLITNQNNNAIAISPSTQSFINQLTNVGLTPTAIISIRRSPFTVPGQMITLNGDNFQVFEYSDHGVAMNEASLMAKRYRAGSKSQWKNDAHIYMNGATVVFYLGQNSAVLDFLNQDAGLSRIDESSQSLLSLSKISTIDN